MTRAQRVSRYGWGAVHLDPAPSSEPWAGWPSRFRLFGRR